MHAAQKDICTQTHSLPKKNTHTQKHKELLSPQALLKARSLIRRLRPASLLLSNGGLLTQTAGVTKQQNGGSEKAGNWLVVITHNFSTIFFKVSWPTNGSMERNMEGVEAIDANASNHINWTTLYRYRSSRPIKKTFQ